MPKIVNTRNNGNPGIRTGEVMVNSGNVYPVSLVATAGGATTITLSLLDGYDFFVGANSSAATDRVILPEGAPVGTEFKIHATNSFGVIKAGSDTINGVATICTITAVGTATLTKVSATKWLMVNQATNGALTAPTT
jgi:hypothetical protein